MRRHDIDFQILLEIGHVLSDIRKRCFPTETSAPAAPVNRPEHDVVGRIDRAGNASGDDDALQFESVDNERLANQTETACLVEKNESWSVSMFNVNDQRKFSNPSRGLAAWAVRETFANVRIEHERISRRQRAHTKFVLLSTRLAHRSELSSRAAAHDARNIVFEEGHLATKAAKTGNNISRAQRAAKKARDWDVIDRMPCAITLLPVPKASMSFYDVDEYRTPRIHELAGTSRARHHAAVHAPESGGVGQRDSAAGSAVFRTEFWRHFGDGEGLRRKDQWLEQLNWR